MNKYWIIGIVSVFLILGWLFWPVQAVPILAYHQVGDEDEIYSVPASQFEEQMRYLSENGYHSISLEELFASYSGTATLPDKPVIITFDDGYSDNYLTALPIMKKYGLSATVFVVPSLIGTPDYLSWEQVVKMQEQHMEIGSHTMSHAGMNEISPKEQRWETAESKAVLERQLGTPIRYFAYPYGQFSPAVEQILKEEGYRGACTGLTGFNDSKTDPYALKRINIPRPKYGYGLWEFRLRLFRAQLYSKLGL